MTSKSILSVGQDERLVARLPEYLPDDFDYWALNNIEAAKERIQCVGPPTFLLVGQTALHSALETLESLGDLPLASQVLLLTENRDLAATSRHLAAGHLQCLLPEHTLVAEMARGIADLWCQQETAPPSAPAPLPVLFRLATVNQTQGLMTGLEVVCHWISEEVDCQFDAALRLAIHLVPAGLAMLPPDELAILRDGNIHSTEFDLSMRRAFLSIAQLLQPLPEFSDTYEILSVAPFADHWFDHQTSQQKLAATVLRISVLVCLLRNEGLTPRLLVGQLREYFPFVKRSLMARIATVPKHDIAEITLSMSELRRGMVLTQTTRFRNGSLIVTAGQRIDTRLYTMILPEIRVSTTRTVNVARESMPPKDRAGKRENFFMRGRSQPKAPVAGCQIWSQPTQTNGADLFG